MTVATLTTTAFQSQITSVIDTLVKQAIAQEYARSETIHQNNTTQPLVKSTRTSMDILNQQSLSQQLLNQPLAIKALANSNSNNIQALTNGKVFEATVLSSTLVRSANTHSTNAKTNEGGQQYQIKIAVGSQQYQLTTKAPIEQGTRIELTLQRKNTINTVTIVNVLNNPSTPNTSAASQHSPSLPTNNAATNNAATTPSTNTTISSNTTASSHSTPSQNSTTTSSNTSSTPSSTVIINGANIDRSQKAENTSQRATQVSTSGASNATPSSVSANNSNQGAGPTAHITTLTDAQKKIIDQAIRQALPLQQPLNKIVTTLRALTPQLLSQLQGQAQANAKEKLLNQIQNTTQGNTLTPTQNKTLTESQLQHHSQILQRTLKLIQQLPKPENLQQAAQLKHFINNSGVGFEKNLAKTVLDTTSTPSNAPIDRDSKALLLQIVGLLKNNSQFNNSETLKDSPAKPSTEASLTYSAKPDSVASSTIQSSSTQTSAENNVDLLLKQLSRLIFSSLARTQLHQLETLASRQGASPEAPMQPANTLVLELPIINGKHVDNLALQIKYEEDQNNNKNDNSKDKLWTVVLNFDLHSLGKLHAQLKVLGTSVAAVLWTQNEDTHDEIKQHLKELKNSFEEIGVNVKQLDIKLGEPPEQTSPLHRQLVDIRT